MAVITISRQFGAGGRTLGSMIARELGYTFADSEVIERIAEAANVTPTYVEGVEKEAGTNLTRIINKMVNKSLVDRILGGERGYMDDQIYLDYLVVIISQMAEEGDVVMLGRGSQYILHDHPEATHILLVDELENRIQFMMKHYELNHKKAAQVVAAEDKRRSTLYHRLGKSDFDDPNLYHLVLNMGRFSLDQALKTVTDYIQS
ncbi:MAG: AAA family ATPase [Thermodesulfobacteriota bacterium]